MTTVVKRNLFNNVEYSPNIAFVDFGEKVDKFISLSSRNIKSARLWIDIDATVTFFGQDTSFGADPKATVKFNGHHIFQRTYNKQVWATGFNADSLDGRWDVTDIINKNGSDKIEFDFDYAGQNVKFVLFSDIVYEMNTDDNVDVTITQETDENTAGSEVGKGVDELGKNVGKGLAEFFTSPSGIIIAVAGIGVLALTLSGGARGMALSGAKAGYKRLRK
tara:strand:+ start:1001 stop:1660 length:660 start_codon:yes stop_codon:yes gene_type:complete